MSERRDRLIEAGRRAAERAGRERREAAAAGPAPRPGDLYALPATAAHAVEWLVVAAAAGRWVVLPADLAGTGGGADVEVPADEPGGPLTVYGRFPVTVPASLLPAALRTGRLAEERRAEAERRLRDLAAGQEPPELETDLDPDYRHRLTELAAARQALAAAVTAAEGGDPGGGPGGGAPRPRGPRPAEREEGAEAPPPVPIVRAAPRRRTPPPWLTALAAVLAIAVVGLGGWNLSLRRQVERATRLTVWQLHPSPPQVVVDDPTRSGELVLPVDAAALSLAWIEAPPPGARFRVRLLDRGGRELAATTIVANGSDEVEVGLSGGDLRPGARLTLVVDRPVENGWEPLAAVPLRIESD